MTQLMLKRSFLNSIGVVAYVSIEAFIMERAEQWLGPGPSTLSAVGFLLLFCVSAAVVGSLVFGYPVVVFLSGQKREGILAAGPTIGGWR